jgi:transcriptional regulator with XRE-family HTH domain
MTEFDGEESSSFTDRPDQQDILTFGRRLKHLRRARGLTLAELGAKVGRAPSALSMLENGRREPRLSQLKALAEALGVSSEELLRRDPPSRRAQLEIAVEEAQRDPVYRALGLPHLKVTTRVPSDVLEHLIALYSELRRQRSKPTATPEEARAANAELRQMMRERGNYFQEIEQAAAAALAAAGYSGGALSQGLLLSVVSHHGFTVRYVQDLPRSVRSLTDLRNRRIYVKQEPVGMHTARAVLLQALGHYLLGHSEPKDFADLATHHLGVPCHFVKNDESGVIYKAYENDGLIFPADPSGAIEGQRMCRLWSGRQVFAAEDRFSTLYQYSDTPSGTYFCVAHVDPGRERGFAVTLGVPYEHSRWFRGRESTARQRSACPDGECCQRPPADLAARWEGMAWPSARAHSHVLSALPAGSFPGVDEADVYEFLDRHSN